MRHAQPALVHAKHTACAGAIIQIAHDVEPTTRVPRIVGVPVAGEDGVVHAADAVSGLFPPLAAAAVDVRPEREAGVAGLPDPESVCVYGRVGGGEEGGGGGGVPVGHEEALGFEDVWVGAGADLGGGPVEFVDGGFVGREGWWWC